MANTQNLSIILDLKDKASAELDKFSNKLDNLKPTFQKMALLGTASFGALSAGIGTTVKAFQAQERAEKRLETLTRNITGATDEQIESLKKQASALQEVGVVGDEVTIAGQSQLATFGLTTDKIEMLTPALLDLVVAQKGVNATQEDAITLANSIGRALDGGAGVLTRYGISLTDAQKEQFELANKTERTALLVDILKNNYGGLNEAMAETSEGQIAKMKMAFGDLQESVGAVFAPAITEMVNKIKGVVEKMQGWISENETLFKWIVVVTLAVTGAIAVFGLLGLAIIAIKTPLMAVSGLFTMFNLKLILIVATIGLVIYTAWQLYKNWDIVVAELKIIFYSLANVVGTIFTVITNTIIMGINMAIKVINSLISALERLPGAKKIGIKQISEFENVDFTIKDFDADKIRAEAYNKSQGNNTTINVSGNTLLDENAAESIGDLIMKQVGLNTGL